MFYGVDGLAINAAHRELLEIELAKLVIDTERNMYRYPVIANTYLCTQGAVTEGGANLVPLTIFLLPTKSTKYIRESQIINNGRVVSLTAHAWTRLKKAVNAKCGVTFHHFDMNDVPCNPFVTEAHLGYFRTFRHLIISYLPKSLHKECEHHGTINAKDLMFIRTGRSSIWTSNFTARNKLDTVVKARKVFYLPRVKELPDLDYEEFVKTNNPGKLFGSSKLDYVYKDNTWCIVLIPNPNISSELHHAIYFHDNPTYNWVRILEAFNGQRPTHKTNVFQSYITELVGGDKN